MSVCLCVGVSVGFSMLMLSMLPFDITCLLSPMLSLIASLFSNDLFLRTNSSDTSMNLGGYLWKKMQEW